MAGQRAGACTVPGTRLVQFDHWSRWVPGLKVLNWMCLGLSGRYSDGDNRFTRHCLLVTFKDAMLEMPS